MSRRAFNLADLAATIVVATVLITFALAALGESRRQARLGEDVASLKRFGAATNAYTADHSDLLWSFSWRGGETYEMVNEDGDLVPTQMPDSDREAAIYQAVHLIRLLGDRSGENTMPIPNGWLPHLSYSHLPLMAYLNESPLERWTTSVADDVRQSWKDDPINKFDEGFWLPLQPDPTPTNRRWPYSMGFELSIAAWAYNQSDLMASPNDRLSQGGSHRVYLVPANARYFDRRLGDVRYAGNKVQIFDTHQRHFGEKQYFFGLEDGVDSNDAPGRVPTLMYDASAGVRAVNDANPGWRPNTPSFPCLTFWYQPNAWEPATTNGQFQEFCHGFFRWTRGGLIGLDFGGAPIDTGQSTPGNCDL